MTVMIPNEIPTHLENATLGEIMDFMISEGFSRKAHGEPLGSWPKGHFRDGKRVGLGYSTFHKARTDKTRVRPDSVTLISQFFLKDLESGNLSAVG